MYYMLVCCHVGVTTISYEDPKVVDSLISKIEDRFGKMTVNIGKKYNFVGIYISFKENRVL